MRTTMLAAFAATCLAPVATHAAPASMLHTLPRPEAHQASGQQPEAQPPRGNWFTKWFHGGSEGEVAPAPVSAEGLPAGAAVPPGLVAYVPPATSPARVAMNSTPWQVAQRPAGLSSPAGSIAAIEPAPTTPLPGTTPTPIGSVSPSGDEPRGDQPDDADCKELRERGHVKDRSGDLAGAERLYRRAIAADPTSAAAVNDLGLCLARQGKLEPSAAVLKQAILMRPEKQLYRNNLATVLVEQGRPEDAVAQLKAVGNEATAHYNVGQLLLRSQKPDQAVAQFRQSLDAEPGFGPAQQALAQLGSATTFASVAATNVARNTQQSLAAATQNLSQNAAATMANLSASASVAAATLPPSDDILPETPAIGTSETGGVGASGAPMFPRLLPPVMGR